MRDVRFYKFWGLHHGSRTGTLYAGMTGFFTQRVGQHKSGLNDGFTKKYGVDRLLHYEVYSDVGKATPRIAVERLAPPKEDQADRENESSLGGSG